jgi:hypothetical protein
MNDTAPKRDAPAAGSVTKNLRSDDMPRHAYQEARKRVIVANTIIFTGNQSENADALGGISPWPCGIPLL